MLKSVVESGKVTHMFTPKIKSVLMGWIEDHIANPYPTEQQRIELSHKTGLSRKQLRNWMSDARRVNS